MAQLQTAFDPSLVNLLVPELVVPASSTSGNSVAHAEGATR
jgi:hypothetical protein